MWKNVTNCNTENRFSEESIIVIGSYTLEMKIHQFNVMGTFDVNQNI